MYSQEYVKARKEFFNCIYMCIFGVGVPIVIAVTVWLPIMREEKRKALEQG